MTDKQYSSRSSMFLFVYFRPCSSQRLSPWLQGLRWEPRKQWKQDRVRKSIWVLWSVKKCLGCSESSRVCFCRVWRSQRCVWCCERTGRKVTLVVVCVVVLFVVLCSLFLFWFFFLFVCLLLFLKKKHIYLFIFGTWHLLFSLVQNHVWLSSACWVIHRGKAL